MHATILAALCAAPACAIRVALGLLFLRAARDKLRDLRGFGDVVRQYDLLPDRLARPAAGLLVAAELVAAALLLSQHHTRLAAGLAAALLALFAAAMAAGLHRGRAGLACGCLAGARLSWSGMRGTALLVPLAGLAAWPWRGDGVTLVQAALAGLLLFALHDAALRLAAVRPAARVG